jgi:hypothetical protein
MKKHSVVLGSIVPGLLAGALVACSATRAPGSSVGASAAARHTASGSQQWGAGMTGDQDALCELNRRLLSARAPDERQAMLDQYLPDMSPEMREWHLKTMRERCQ